MHSKEERLEKGEILANEVLRAVEKCRSETMTEEEKIYHLEQIEALARDCVCGQYDKSDEDAPFGGGC